VETAALLRITPLIPMISRSCYQSGWRWLLHQVKHRRGSTVAFVVACVFVLQSFLSVWASTAMAATPMLDRFGNPLCITSVEHGDTSPASDHSNLPDCCTVGCCLSSLLFGTGAIERTGLLRLLSSAEVPFHLFQTFQIQSPDHAPGSPRAPPLTT